MTRRLLPLIQDEQGKASTARVLLIQTVQVALLLAVLDALGLATARESLTEQLTVFVIVFASWAGGARLAGHLMPALAALFSRTRGGAYASGYTPPQYHTPHVPTTDEASG
jgi:hypothetical protein